MKFSWKMAAFIFGAVALYLGYKEYERKQAAEA